jgi:hypothetical protein
MMLKRIFVFSIIAMVLVLTLGSCVTIEQSQDDGSDTSGTQGPGIRRPQPPPTLSGEDEDSSGSGLTRPDFSGLNIGKRDPSITGSSSSDTEECEDDCKEAYDDKVKKAKATLAAAMANCGFLPVVPPPAPQPQEACREKAQEEYDEAIDKYEEEYEECKEKCK